MFSLISLPVPSQQMTMLRGWSVIVPPSTVVPAKRSASRDP
jgi:hypothetical protein